MPNTKRKQSHLKSVSNTNPPATGDETKRDRFIRIGNARMQRALNSIRLLGNLANSNYDWAEDDIRAMQNAVIDQLNRTMNRFSKKTEVPGFTFEKVSDL